jgi:hypothetical protein
VLSFVRASSRRSFGSSSSTRRMTSFRTTLLFWFRTTSQMPRSEGELGDASLLLATLCCLQHGDDFCAVLFVGLQYLAGCSTCGSSVLAGVVFSSTADTYHTSSMQTLLAGHCSDLEVFLDDKTDVFTDWSVCPPRWFLFSFLPPSL